MTALVSVLIPSYNYERYVLDAIDSVLGQTLTDISLMIVDDGSTDTSPMIIEQHLQSISPQRATLIVQEHRGLCATLNAFLDASRTKYIAMLGADDLWDPHNLELQVAALEEAGPTYGASYTDCWIINAVGDRIGRWGSRDGFRGGNIYSDLVELKYFPPSATSLFVRDVVVRVGGWPTIRHVVEDHDLWLRLAKNFDVMYLPRPLGSYRTHGENASTTRLDEFYADELTTLDELLRRDPELRPRERELRGRVEAAHAGRLYGALRLSEARTRALSALRMNRRDRQAWRIATRSLLGRRAVTALRTRREAARRGLLVTPYDGSTEL